jgi:hypothetical protein
MKWWWTSMRVLPAGAWAAAGAARPATAPKPSAATPPAMKLRRAGLAGVAGSAQQLQLRKNFRDRGI